MRLVSVNCGLPHEVEWHGRTVTTGIYKQPVKGRVTLRSLNLERDKQADITVNGRESKAVFCYPLAYYDYWKAELPGHPLPMGVFGENFTTDGLLESTVFVGDKFSIGSAQVVVTQPRLPCYKLGIRFESDEMVKRFLISARTGFYVAVKREGSVAAEDQITVVDRDRDSMPVSEITRLYVTKKHAAADPASARRALSIDGLPDSWKDYFAERLRRSKV